MLFNPETNRVMIIDFERAKLEQPQRRPLTQLVPNKRTWSNEVTNKTMGRDDGYGGCNGKMDVGSDILMARSALSELNWYAGR
jgi:hypothetical protein